MRNRTSDSLCNESFSQSSNLQTHMRRAHSNRRPYQCPYCGMMFKTNQEMRRHDVFTLVQSCTHVDTVQNVLWFHPLKRHLLESHNEGTCHICQKKFVHSCDFKVHEGVKPYVCTGCPKRFYTSSNFKRHQLVHSDIRGFACGLCAKSFKYKQSVVIHFKRCVSRLGFSDM